MSDKKLYIIAGCNGAGKTTASFTILPEILDCKEFVNADEIAKGLSPFQPEKVAFEAGRIMLGRINELLKNNENFAFETTLSTKSYKNKIKEAQQKGYTDRKSTRLNSSHVRISYAVFCLKKKNTTETQTELTYIL